MKHGPLLAVLILAACDTFPGPSLTAQLAPDADADCLLQAVSEAPGVVPGEPRTETTDAFGIVPWGPITTRHTGLPLTFDGETFVFQLTEENGEMTRLLLPGYGWSECPPPRFLAAHARLVETVTPRLERCTPRPDLQLAVTGRCEVAR